MDQRRPRLDGRACLHLQLGGLGNTSFTFTGGVATVLGVRCVGRVHTSSSAMNSWVANATELQAFAAPVPPPPVSILLTNPPDGARYTAPATIPIQASVITTTGSISQVEFFCDTTNLGEAVSPPYSITWSNVPPGSYPLSASATDSRRQLWRLSGRPCHRSRPDRPD